MGLKGEQLTRLTSLLVKEAYPKGHLLLQEGKTEKFLYFLEKGIARVFFFKDHKEVTLCFCLEGDILLSLRSYFASEPGYENIELLEDATVYRISQVQLQQLYTEDLQLANWGRKLAEFEFMRADERFMAQQFKPAAERYEDFISTYPTILQRVALGHIASYLGISQVTLSRIRADIK